MISTKKIFSLILILNINLINCGKKELEQEFIEAAKGDINKITNFISQYVITKTISIDAKDEEGLTALAKALFWNQKNIAQVLLAHGANPNEKISNASKFSPRADWDYRNETILTWTAHWLTKEYVELLFNNGADINKTGLYEMTPLMKASSSGKKEIVEFLLEKGAKTNLKDKYGYTAFVHATLNGHDEIVKIILEHDNKNHNNNIEEKDKDGLTVLDHAKKMNKENIIKLLTIKK